MGCASPTPAQLLGVGGQGEIIVSSVEGCELFLHETLISIPERDPAPHPAWNATPSPLLEACGYWVRWGRTMEEPPFKASAESSGRHDSVKSSSRSDIRHLWSRAMLSQPKLTSVYKDSELEGNSADTKTGQWYNQETSDDSDDVWEECNDRNGKVCTKQEEPDRYNSPRSSLRRHLEGKEDSSGTKMEISSSMSSLSITQKHTPHRAYWVEQQNMLPLPLMELMESEVLEILTKALQSYRSGIGKDHVLTKQLQRYIERLKRRRNKRQHVSALRVPPQA